MTKTRCEFISGSTEAFTSKEGDYLGEILGEWLNDGWKIAYIHVKDDGGGTILLMKEEDE